MHRKNHFHPHHLPLPVVNQLSALPETSTNPSMRGVNKSVHDFSKFSIARISYQKYTYRREKNRHGKQYQCAELKVKVISTYELNFHNNKTHQLCSLLHRKSEIWCVRFSFRFRACFSTSLSSSCREGRESWWVVERVKSLRMRAATSVRGMREANGKWREWIRKLFVSHFFLSV